jgi:hypothetical protein
MDVLRYPEAQGACCPRDVQDRSHYPETAGCQSRDARGHCRCREAWADPAMVDPPADVGVAVAAAAVADWVAAADSAGRVAVVDAAAAADASSSCVGRTTAAVGNNDPSSRRY